MNLIYIIISRLLFGVELGEGVLGGLANDYDYHH